MFGIYISAYGAHIQSNLYFDTYSITLECDFATGTGTFAFLDAPLQCVLDNGATLYVLSGYSSCLTKYVKDGAEEFSFIGGEDFSSYTDYSTTIDIINGTWDGESLCILLVTYQDWEMGNMTLVVRILEGGLDELKTEDTTEYGSPIYEVTIEGVTYRFYDLDGWKTLEVVGGDGGMSGPLG